MGVFWGFCTLGVIRPALPNVGFTDRPSLVQTNTHQYPEVHGKGQESNKHIGDSSITGT